MRQVLRRAWIPLLGIAWSLTPALAQKDLQQDPATPPGFSRIDISSAAALRFEGAGAPDDRIALHIDGRQAARASVDAQGEWRIEREQRLPPGDDAARAISIGQADSAARVSEDERIAIPDPVLPAYASPEKDANADASPPDAETLRRASELARDASQMFSEVIGKGEASASQDQLAGDQNVPGGATHAPARERQIEIYNNGNHRKKNSYKDK